MILTLPCNIKDRIPCDRAAYENDKSFHPSFLTNKACIGVVAVDAINMDPLRGSEHLGEVSVAKCRTLILVKKFPRDQNQFS